MHDDNKVSREQIENKLKELVALFEAYNEDEQNEDYGSLNTLAEFAITEIVNWTCINHYEGLGILEEALQSFRENSLEAMCECEDGEVLCEECKEKRKKEKKRDTKE